MKKRKDFFLHCAEEIYDIVMLNHQPCRMKTPRVSLDDTKMLKEGYSPQHPQQQGQQGQQTTGRHRWRRQRLRFGREA